MAQRDVWEREYRRPRLIAQGEARTDVKDFVRWMRREYGYDLEDMSILDLGCGTGSNALYCAERGARVVGLDSAPTAIKIARERAARKGYLSKHNRILSKEDEGGSITYRVGSIGEPLPYPDGSFDVALDVMSSNSLNEAERAIYLREVARVLLPSGLFFVRALCKDGDSNAKQLLATHPGPEPDTYIMPGLGLIERVFSRADFELQCGASFTFLKLDKKTNYARVGDRTFKRNYWIAYLQSHKPPQI